MNKLNDINEATASRLDEPRSSLRNYFFGIQQKNRGPAIKPGAIKNMQDKLRRKIVVAETADPPLLISADIRQADREAQPFRVEPKYTMIHRSGQVAIYKLGDDTIKLNVQSLGPAWKFKPQRSKLDTHIQLCPGMTGRFIFGAKSEFHGRCFEWQISVDKIGSPLYVGKPKFQLWELEPNLLGLLERSNKATVFATSPNSLWDEAYRQILHRPGCVDGARMCGLQDPLTAEANVEVADLMALHGADPARLFGLRKDLNSVSERWRRQMRSVALQKFEQMMKEICPSDPHLVFATLLESAAFQAEWYPDATVDELMRMPFVLGLVEACTDATTKGAKIAILSLFAPYFSHHVTMSLFGVSAKLVTQAKLHDADGNSGITLPPTVHRRMRLSPRTFAFLYQWCRSSYAVTAGCPSNDNLVRLEIRERLHPRYVAMAKREGVTSISKDHFNVHMRDGFQDETVESCCCGGCIDGWVALNMLDDFVMDPRYEFPARKKLSKRITAIMDFFKGDYRWRHLAESSKEAQHCMQLALGCNVPALCVACDHDHTNSCLQCNMYPALIMECEQHIAEFGARRLSALRAGAQMTTPATTQMAAPATAQMAAPAAAKMAAPAAAQMTAPAAAQTTAPAAAQMAAPAAAQMTVAAAAQTTAPAGVGMPAAAAAQATAAAEAQATAPAAAQMTTPAAAQMAAAATQTTAPADAPQTDAPNETTNASHPTFVPVQQTIEECEALLTSMQQHLKMIDGEIRRYQSHIVRKHKASKGQMDLMSYVTIKCAMCYIDYKMKILPKENKNAQSTSFGQRGKSLFDAVMVFKIPPDYTGEIPKDIDRDGDFCIAYQRVAANDADQDYVHSVQVFETAMRFFKKLYPWVEEFLLYSDGAGNFRSLSFEIAMAERMAEVGVKVICHLLPEAGDGKDRADRDFAGVNKLLQSWLKRRKASCQNATEIYEALEYGKRPGDGVTNCAVAINKPLDAPAVDTVAFAKLVGKARGNMFYTGFIYAEASDGGKISLAGARFFAYYKMGGGVCLNRSQLDALWPNKPMIATARVIAGKQASEVMPMMKPKMERSREGKKADKQKRADAKKRKIDAIEEKQKEVDQKAASRQRSKRCCTCDRSFLHKSNRDIHGEVCAGKTTVQSREASANIANTFDSLKGATVEITDSTVLPVPQDDGYAQWIGDNWCWDTWLSLVTSWATEEYSNNPKHLEEVKKVLESTNISPQMEAACTANWLVGWATKEQCRRPSISFSTEVVDQLRFCFDTVPRMNAHEIRKHLMHCFTLGPNVLRISQISGWVSSEVKRRKERLVRAAAGVVVGEEIDANSAAAQKLKEKEAEDAKKEAKQEAKRVAIEVKRVATEAKKAKKAADKVAEREKKEAEKVAERQKQSTKKAADKKKQGAEKAARKQKQGATQEKQPVIGGKQHKRKSADAGNGVGQDDINKRQCGRLLPGNVWAIS